MHKRRAIRESIISALQGASIDVKKIISSRPSPVLLKEVPVCLVYYNDEDVQVISGSENVPKEYRRELELKIDVIVDAYEGNEDFIDAQCEKIELAISDKWDLDGNALGLRLSGVKPYTIDDGADRLWWSTSMSFIVIYESSAFLDIKHPSFNEYEAKINKFGYDENTIDPTLIEGDGSIT